MSILDIYILMPLALGSIMLLASNEFSNSTSSIKISKPNLRM